MILIIAVLNWEILGNTLRDDSKMIPLPDTERTRTTGKSGVNRFKNIPVSKTVGFYS